ncbi:hypothetical protein [Kitasatospora sp. NPDC050463]
MTHETQVQMKDFIRTSTANQGLPEKITDQAALREAARFVKGRG